MRFFSETTLRHYATVANKSAHASFAFNALQANWEFSSYIPANIGRDIKGKEKEVRGERESTTFQGCTLTIKNDLLVLGLRKSERRKEREERERVSFSSLLVSRERQIS